MLDIRRRMMMNLTPQDIIIDARKGDANAVALMNVIYKEGWSKSPKYMTKREAEKVKKIGREFFGNTSITNFEALKYFTSLNTILDIAFKNCSNLQKVLLPIQFTRLDGMGGSGRFSYCSSLKSINIEQIEYLGNGNEFRNTALESIQLNEKLPSIPNACFYNCNRLTKIVIPDSVTSIGSSSFRRCALLANVEIGTGITEIGSQAFEKVSSQSKLNVKIHATTPPVIQSNTFTSSFVNAIYVPDESVGVYEAADIWSALADRIKPLSELPS